MPQKPPFDPNKPFGSEEGSKPAFDPSKPFEKGETPQPPVSLRPPDLPFAAAPSPSTASPSTLESGNGSAASEGSGQPSSAFDPIAFRKQWKADQVAKIDEQLRRKKFGGSVAGENMDVDVVQGDERKKLLMARDYLMRDQRAKEAFTLSVEPGTTPERVFAKTRLLPPEGQQPAPAEVVMDDRRAKLYDDYNRYAEAASKISGDSTLPGMRFTKKERDSRIEARAWDSGKQNQYEAAVLTHASQSLRGRELLLEENVAKYGANETLKAEAEEIVAGKEFLAQELELAAIHYRLAELDMARKTYTNALRLVQQGSASRDWNSHILQRMADIDMQRLDWKQALRVFEQIRTIAPDDDPRASS